MKKVTTIALLFVTLCIGSSAVPVHAQTTTNSCPSLSHYLYRGINDAHSNDEVTLLQQFLSSRYSNQLITGYFGPLTAANIAAFQQDQGIVPVTGGVGPLTRSAIARQCAGSVGQTSYNFSANPTSGAAPLQVTFAATPQDANQYIIEYGDGTNSGPIQSHCLSNQSYPGYTGPASSCTITNAHTYAARGTYTAVLSRYIGCMYSNPRCMIATLPLGTATISVF